MDHRWVSLLYNLCWTSWEVKINLGLSANTSTINSKKNIDRCCFYRPVWFGNLVSRPDFGENGCHFDISTSDWVHFLFWILGLSCSKPQFVPCLHIIVVFILRSTHYRNSKCERGRLHFGSRNCRCINRRTEGIHSETLHANLQTEIKRNQVNW